MGKEKMYYEQLGYDFDPPFYRAKDKPVITNADKIRAMSDTDLCGFICSITNCFKCPTGYSCVLNNCRMFEWLTKEG